MPLRDKGMLFGMPGSTNTCLNLHICVRQSWLTNVHFSRTCISNMQVSIITLNGGLDTSVDSRDLQITLTYEDRSLSHGLQSKFTDHNTSCSRENVGTC
jgi:hypothetical protein